MDRVIASYNIDPVKTILTGYSLGGMGTWYIAGRNQNRFSAAIPIAGIPNIEADWKVPLYVIHSSDDEVIPLSPTKDYVKQLKAQGMDVEFVVIDGVTHYQTAAFIEPLRAAVPWIRQIWE